jgi:hypothetical protein
MKKTGFRNSDGFFGVLVSVVIPIPGIGELSRGRRLKPHGMDVAANSDMTPTGDRAARRMLATACR